MREEDGEERVRGRGMNGAWNGVGDLGGGSGRSVVYTSHG